MAVVWIPALYRDLTAGEATVTVPGDTVRQLIENLDVRFPGVKARLYADDDARLRPGLVIVVDGAVVRDRSRVLRTPLTDASEVHFLPAISGGARSHPARQGRPG
jgi:molybdopterin converting factor small subunit